MFDSYSAMTCDQLHPESWSHVYELALSHVPDVETGLYSTAETGSTNSSGRPASDLAACFAASTTRASNDLPSGVTSVTAPDAPAAACTAAAMSDADFASRCPESSGALSDARMLNV